MPLPLDTILSRLADRYGKIPEPPPKTAFESILHECACYLVDDERRDAVFEELKRRVGCSPRELLRADRGELLAILEPGGMRPPMRLEKVIDAATICIETHGGDLDSVLGLPVKAAVKELRRYPGIGIPSAQRILLFHAKVPSLALESNGLRVLLRLGHGREDPRYDVAYKSVQTSLAAEVGTDCKRLTRAHLLLRHHGKVTCKRSEPCCDECPLAKDCPSRATSR